MLDFREATSPRERGGDCSAKCTLGGLLIHGVVVISFELERDGEHGDGLEALDSSCPIDLLFSRRSIRSNEHSEEKKTICN